MRKKRYNRIFSGLAFTAIMAAGLSSCSNELNEPLPVQPDNDMLVGTPRVLAYSGSHYWNQFGNTTRSGVPEEFSDVVSFETVWKNYGEIDYAAETKTVSSVLGEGTNNIDRLDTDFLYHATDDITFEMYPVYQHTSHSPNYLGVFYYDSEGQLHQQKVWENIDLYNFNDWQNNGGKSKGIKISIKKGYKFGFFIEGYDNSWNLLNYYSLSSLNPELDRYNDSGKSRVHAGTFEINGKTYLCFEDWTDFDYQDIVFASFTSLPTVDEEDQLPDTDDNDKPGVTEPGETDPDEDDTDKPVVTPDQPSDDDDSEDNVGDIMKKGFDEVEINLSLDEKDNEDFASHLSLHVRYATDVEVFIPVPAKYYCDADDMAIVIDKVDGFVHGGPYTSEFNIGGSTVRLNVEFKADGIRIWTDGINQNVIDYCREKYNDGITFEVWNYFNDPDKTGDLPISKEELRTYLDRASVRFMDSVPPTYINAFGEANGKYSSSNPSGNDFHVTPENHIDEFESPVEGTHHNGSDINDIYKNKENKQ